MYFYIARVASCEYSIANHEKNVIAAILFVLLNVIVLEAKLEDMRM